jgi:hypothetical protein
VDAKWTASRQLDVVIANRSSAPTLFTAENGSSYYPFEAVFAYGEVKSTYYSAKRPIHQLVESTQLIRRELIREKTPLDYIGGMRLGHGLKASAGSWTYRNPLFSFAFFASANDFAISQVAELYRTTAAANLPQLVIFLDRGFIANHRLYYSPTGNTIERRGINLHPEFSSPGVNERNGWLFLEFDQAKSVPAASFGTLVFALLHHLERCELTIPDMVKYLQPLFCFTSIAMVAEMDGTSPS